MKEIKNIFSSILCVIKIKPSYLLVKIFSIITSIITALIPVMVVKEIVNIYYNSQDIGKIAVIVGICFLIVAVIHLINFVIDLYDGHIKRIFIAEESIIFYKKLSTLDYEIHESPLFLNDYTIALELHYEMLELIRALFIESNPVPVKTAMNLMGLPSGPLRQPLCEMQEDNLEVLKKALKESNLI